MALERGRSRRQEDALHLNSVHPAADPGRQPAVLLPGVIRRLVVLWREVLVLERRRQEDALHVNLFILLLILIVSLLFYYLA
ncbi:hypothetical protein [Aeromonas rivipollensis]|uniref:hypothetical protein n=1 Tax=Aeromonas rivipollensis TaxID=948519 RepID=UPI00259FCCAF|nr:hypothetical protein [Aeromonas rivipollensis]MDM5058537.1 hypothetical protein [Aeromonas rivipollensis]